MCLIVGELLPQKNWLETSHFRAKTDSRLPSYCWQEYVTAHHVEIWCPLPSFPRRSCKTVQLGPSPISSGKMYTDWARIWPSMAVTPGYQPIRRLPLNFAGLSETSWVAAAMPAWSGLFICLILFSQYVIISYTQYTLNKVCIGPFVFIPT